MKGPDALQVTQNRLSVFGTLINGRMHLSPAGQRIQDTWQEIPRFCPAYHLDAFVVMPDHVHGVVYVEDHVDRDDDAIYHDYRAIRTNGVAAPTEGCRDGVPTLFDFMHRFKSLTTSRYIQGVKQAGWPRFEGKLWQREYYEHIVRDHADLARIRIYIRDNPANTNRLQISELRFHGNRELLKLRKTAFLASRTSNNDHRTSNIVRRGTPPWVPPPDCVISSFLSPLEREVFHWCRQRKIPTIRLLARAFDDKLPLGADQLVITPFTDALSNQARAAWCNQYELAHADEVVIGALNPDGMLALLLSDLPCEMPVSYPVKQCQEDATHEQTIRHQ